MSSEAAAGHGTHHRLAGTFSSRLQSLLSQESLDGTSTAEIVQARDSFISAVGLSSPEAKDGVSPEVMKT